MEIIVEGKGESFVTPNQVVLHLHFFVKGDKYDEVLEKGSANVLTFINTILLAQGFAKEELKTSSFVIKKELEYNDSTRTYDFVGYSYNQNATLKFGYDKEKLAIMMEEIAKMTNPPFYEVDFTLEDIEACRRVNLTKAYKDAEAQAQILADAASKTLKGCIKVDFQPITTDYSSGGFKSDMLFEESVSMGMAKMSASKTINAAFTPEDVHVFEKLYCLWIAE